MSALVRAARSYGIGWLARRCAYELQVRSGYQTIRFPQRPWDTDELLRWIDLSMGSDSASYAQSWRAHRRPFFFEYGQRANYADLLRSIVSPVGGRAPVVQADEIREGVFEYFFGQKGQLGFPPAWHRNPFSGQTSSGSLHWTNIPMYARNSGDLKFIWEPGRMASAYTLARASWISGREEYGETFWQLIESWAAANPPNQGAHWKCGQESSFRIMAWCFALYAFADSPSTTPARIALLVGMIAAQADRIGKDHVYARLQRNNHAISEGVGLWTAALLFPELRPAARWRQQAHDILVREAREQIASDGSYVQNSTNYHRLMLHDYIWALQLGDLNGAPLPEMVRQRVAGAVDFLYQLQDEATGQVPCYGHNDGALILPLNSCDYSDFRPVLSAAHYYFRKERLFESGPWEEDLLWLYGPESLRAPVQKVARHSHEASDGGYYVLRSANSFGLTRCTSYRYRPAQADMLALDLWWHGQNVCCDAGTFLYYAAPPWSNSLVRTEVHNTVSVDSEDQMPSGPRFMWFNWTKARVLGFTRTATGKIEVFQGEHYGYGRLNPPVTHRRAIVRYGNDLWLVVDDLLGDGRHDLACQWLLGVQKYQLNQGENKLELGLQVGKGVLHWHAPGFEPSLSMGDEELAPRGWRSRYYGIREPALSFRLSGNCSEPRRIISLFSFGQEPTHLDVQESEVSIGNVFAASLSPINSGAKLSVTSVVAADETLLVEPS